MVFWSKFHLTLPLFHHHYCNRCVIAVLLQVDTARLKMTTPKFLKWGLKQLAIFMKGDEQHPLELGEKAFTFLQRADDPVPGLCLFTDRSRVVALSLKNMFMPADKDRKDGANAPRYTALYKVIAKFQKAYYNETSSPKLQKFFNTLLCDIVNTTKKKGWKNKEPFIGTTHRAFETKVVINIDDPNFQRFWYG